MGRKPKAAAAEVVLDPDSVPGRTVHVRENIVKTYDAPMETVDDDELEIDDESDDDAGDDDPIQRFIADLTPDDSYMLRAYALPSYFMNGKTGTKVEDSMFVTQFQFGRDESFEFENIVKSAHRWDTTPGGKACFEFVLVKRGIRGWEYVRNGRFIKIITAPLPGHSAPQAPAQYPVIVNPPPAPPPPDPVRPIETVKEQMSVIKTMVDLVDAIRPPQAPASRNADSDGGSVTEKIALALLGRPDTPLDRVVEVLGAGAPKSTGFTDLLVEYAPHIGPSIGQGLNSLMMSFARRVELGNQQAAQAARANQIAATTQPALASGQPPSERGAAVDSPAPAESAAPTLEEPPAADAPAPEPPNPFVIAYRKALGRLVEDCYEQVAMSKANPVGGPVLNPKPVAEGIYALTERFGPEEYPQENAALMQLLHLESGSLLNQPPEIAVQIIAAAAPNERIAGYVMALLNEPAALKWIEVVQTEIKDIIREAQEGNEEEGKN